MDQESIEPARGQQAPDDPTAEPPRFDGLAAPETTTEQPVSTPHEGQQSPWQPAVANLPQSAWQPGPVANVPQSTWQPQVPPMQPVARPYQQFWQQPAGPWHPPLLADAGLPPGWHAPLRTDLVPIRPRKRHGKRLLVIAAAVVVMLVAGVTTWLVWPPDRSPFEQAVANLAAQPVVDYRSDLPDGSQWDGRTTNQGDAVGWLTASRLKFPFLFTNGRMYVQMVGGLVPPGVEDILPSGAKLTNRWATGDLGDLAPLIKQQVTPKAIADKLRDEVARTEKLPTPSDDGTTVDNVAVLKADTPDGTLYVAKNQPYRVVRWVDKNTRKAVSAFTSPGRKLQLNAARAAYTGLGTADFTPMNADDVDKTYDDLETDVGQLGDAINTDVQLSKGDIVQDDAIDKCVQTGCTVTVHFTAAPKLNAKVPAQVPVQMNVDLFLNDLPAGSCSSTTTIASTGTATLSCVDKDMKGPFDQASAKAKADAEAKAIGGYYSWIVEAKVDLFAVPLAAVDTVAEGKRLESFRPDHACGWSDQGGANRDPVYLDGNFTARFDTARFPDFEIHVFQGGQPYGDYGPSGWFAKPGSAVPTNPPAQLETQLKTFAVTFMKAHGTLKDGDSTDGDKWKRPAPQC